MSVRRLILLVLCCCGFSIADTLSIKFFAVKNDAAFALTSEGYLLMSGDGGTSWHWRNTLQDVEAMHVNGSDLFVVQTMKNVAPKYADDSLRRVVRKSTNDGADFETIYSTSWRYKIRGVESLKMPYFRGEPRYWFVDGYISSPSTGDGYLNVYADSAVKAVFHVWSASFISSYCHIGDAVFIASDMVMVSNTFLEGKIFGTGIVLQPRMPMTGRYTISAINDVLFAQSTAGTVVASTDSGQTWTPWVGKLNGAKKYFGGFLGIEAGSVVRSIDTLRSWTKILDRPVTNLVFDDERVYATTNSDTLWLSRDSGTTWEERFVTFDADTLKKGPGIELNWFKIDNLKQVIPSQGKKLNAVVHGQGKFVAVGDSGLILDSETGSSWRRRKSGIDTMRYNWLQSVAYGNGRFVAVSDARTLFSKDGASWSVADSARNMLFVGFGRDRFFGYGYSPGNGLGMSSDGEKWTNIMPSLGPVFSFLYAKNKYFLVGYGDWSSSDGLSWDTDLETGSNPSYSITYGNNQFVLLKEDRNGGADAPRMLLVSKDAKNWEALHPFGAERINVVSFFDSMFVAAGDGGALLVSKDLVTWTRQKSQTTENLRAIAYGNGAFVVVGANGTILTTDSLPQKDGVVEDTLPKQGNDSAKPAPEGFGRTRLKYLRGNLMMQMDSGTYSGGSRLELFTLGGTLKYSAEGEFHSGYAIVPLNNMRNGLYVVKMSIANQETIVHPIMIAD